MRSEALRTAAIQVDDFSQEEYLGHRADAAPCSMKPSTTTSRQ
jgi:hypothetical protein